MKTLSIGNATFDLFVRTGRDLACTEEGRCALRFPLGDKIPIEQVREMCGGGAANTAVGLARLGCSAAFCGVLGDDKWGAAMRANFRKEKVNTRGATIVAEETSSFSLILSVKTGERVIFTSAGANTHLQDSTFDRRRASAADWVYLNRLFPRGCMIADDLLAILSRDDPPGFTWNPGGSQLEDGIRATMHRALLPHTDLLLLNRDESLLFTGASTVEDALRLFARSSVGVACITDGNRSTVATDGFRIARCTPPPAEIVDTTGAGDAFGVGATWACMQGLDLPTILRAGTLNAASVIGYIGAQPGLLTKSNMEQRLRACDLRVETTVL